MHDISPRLIFERLTYFQSTVNYSRISRIVIAIPMIKTFDGTSKDSSSPDI